ncbi:MAG TPA: hypothetical protein VMU52_03440 [Steroidobacteraceae bacterium]|nr:hypothetical protein [Steroidobacteraceae bacterium]
MIAFDLAAQGTALGRSLNRFCAVALLVAAAAGAGCSWGPHHPDWVIHSTVELIGAPPAGGYRLIFPYIVGDFYGAPNTGSFVVPVSRTAGGFTLDLNRTQDDLEKELGPTDFELRFMRIKPRDARLARLTPIALQRDGIEAVGRMDWLDGQSRRPLMLVYVDRPARIEGSDTRDGKTIRYDIRVANPGYVWIGATGSGGSGPGQTTLYTMVPPPRRTILTITTNR